MKLTGLGESEPLLLMQVFEFALEKEAFDITGKKFGFQKLDMRVDTGAYCTCIPKWVLHGVEPDFDDGEGTDFNGIHHDNLEGVYVKIRLPGAPEIGDIRALISEKAGYGLLGRDVIAKMGLHLAVDGVTKTAGLFRSNAFHRWIAQCVGGLPKRAED